MKKNIKPLLEIKHPTGNGIQKLYRFKNGYGASVVRNKIGDIYASYTRNELEWELAVIKWMGKGIDDFIICYDTKITYDVIGYLTTKEVEKYLIKIKNI